MVAGRAGAARHRDDCRGDRISHGLAKRRDLIPVFEFSIREAEGEDLPQILAIYNHYVAHSTVTFDEQPLTLEELRGKFDHLRGLGFPFIVAEGPGRQVLGYASVYPWKAKAAYRFTGEISIYLHPTATGKGLGKILLTELIERSREAGIKEIVAVIADSGGEASVRLHRDCGFVETGHLNEVGYKFDRWLGTILMQKSLRIVDR